MRPSFLPQLRNRETRPELMDDRGSDHQLLEQTLKHFRLINICLTPSRSVLRKHVLKPMSRQPEREYHLVDLGAGGCDTPVWLLKEADRRKLRLRVTACDHDPRVVQYARNKYGSTPNLTIDQRSVWDLDDLGSVDFVFANHLLHHLDEPEIDLLMDKLGRMMHTRVIVSDLCRSYFVYFSFALISAIFFRRSFVRYDGLLSVRKGFTVSELRNIARKTFPRNRNIQVKRAFPGHILLLV